VFTAQGLPPFVPILLFQGTTTSSGFAYGDGLLCTGGSIIRFGVKFSSAAGSAAWPSGADLQISAFGGVPLAGGIREYQAYFRDAINFCTSATFNLTQGVEVLWLP